MAEPYRAPEAEIREVVAPFRYRAAFIGAVSGFIVWQLVAVYVYVGIGFPPKQPGTSIRMALAAGIAGMVLSRLPRLRWYAAIVLGIVLTTVVLFGVAYAWKFLPIDV